MAQQADYRYVLMESIAGLVEKARQLVPSTPYEQGRAMAYFEILSALKNEAEVSVHLPLPVTADFPAWVGYGTL